MISAMCSGLLKKNPRAEDLARGFFGSLRFQRGSRPNSDNDLNRVGW